jgi:hypothetical protein
MVRSPTDNNRAEVAREHGRDGLCAMADCSRTLWGTAVSRRSVTSSGPHLPLTVKETRMDETIVSDGNHDRHEVDVARKGVDEVRPFQSGLRPSPDGDSGPAETRCCQSTK